MNSIEKSQTSDIAYEIGKIGSMGVRSNAISINITPRIRIIPENKCSTKEWVDHDMDTYTPKFIM